MITRYRFLADGEPVQLSTSYEPLALTAGTPIEKPESGPLFGVLARMDSIGHRVSHVIERVTMRAPLPHENEDLKIPAGVHVLCIIRTHYAQAIPVETCNLVVPGDRYELTYRIAIED